MQFIDSQRLHANRVNEQLGQLPRQFVSGQRQRIYGRRDRRDVTYKFSDMRADPGRRTNPSISLKARN